METEGAHAFQDPRAGGGRDRPLTTEHIGHGARGDTRVPGDVGDGDRPPGRHDRKLIEPIRVPASITRYRSWTPPEEAAAAEPPVGTVASLSPAYGSSS